MLNVKTGRFVSNVYKMLILYKTQMIVHVIPPPTSSLKRANVLRVLRNAHSVRTLQISDAPSAQMASSRVQGHLSVVMNAQVDFQRTQQRGRAKENLDL